jgi:hypothetical protein
LLSTLSSSVDAKALISLGGKSLINQIVSFKSISFHIHFSLSVKRNIFQILVQSVAKSLFSARIFFLVNKFNSDDLPVFV